MAYLSQIFQVNLHVLSIGDVLDFIIYASFLIPLEFFLTNKNWHLRNLLKMV
jgi:hypothetical protein